MVPLPCLGLGEAHLAEGVFRREPAQPTPDRNATHCKDIYEYCLLLAGSLSLTSDLATSYSSSRNIFAKYRLFTGIVQAGKEISFHKVIDNVNYILSSIFEGEIQEWSHFVWRLSFSQED